MEIVIPVRKGGLGNQMFQIAAALVVHYETGKQIVLPKAMPHIHSSATYEDSIFQDFTNRLPVVINDNVLYQLQQEGFLLYPGQPAFEPWFPPQEQGPLILHGYFQYYPPIQRHREKIVSVFLQGLRNYIQKGEPTTIGIHVRRGDYLKFSDVFTILEESYYKSAIAQIGKKIQGPKTYNIFSEDIEWCKSKNVFQTLQNAEFVEEPDELKCLGKMIACEGGFICANSTFSWWGAFLGAYQKGAPCIVPNVWMKGFTGDLIPKDWIQVPIS